MSAMDEKYHWMFFVKILILFNGMIFMNTRMISAQNEPYPKIISRNTLFVMTENFTKCNSSTERVVNGTKVCFIVWGETHTDCCSTGDFNCSFETVGKDTIKIPKEILFKQDVVVTVNMSTCMPSVLYNPTDSMFLNLHNCLDSGSKNIRIGCGGIYGDDLKNCTDADDDILVTYYTVNITHRYCDKDIKYKPKYFDISVDTNSDGSISAQNAEKVISFLPSLLDQMEKGKTAHITAGEVKGIITKLPTDKQNDIIYGIRSSGLSVFDGVDPPVSAFTRTVKIPSEAIEMALERNGSYAGIVFFPKMYQDDPDSAFLNDEAIAIDMNAEIRNLSETIDIHFENVTENGMIASCRSWNGSENQNWTTDGCKTNYTNGSITCHCSHLTFFAILLSRPSTNISSSDFKSLTYITSAGCGLSIFFIVVAFFMHFLIRKGKASQATTLLMHLFAAMFTLNLSFLVNEKIANLNNRGACVTIAAIMHYTLLATFSWFFIQALHLYLSMRKISTDIKHYMKKICITGWVIPSVVVIILLALGKYDYLDINTTDGISAKMCWILDANIHEGVNVGYYAVVFVFTFTVFIIIVRQIALFKSPAGLKQSDSQNTSSTKTKSYAVMGLFLLLGITWAFVFFSHGPLLIPSYYIFTILNSFQGFFLFIYYYNSSKVIGDEKNATFSSSSSNSTATSNTVAIATQ